MQLNPKLTVCRLNRLPVGSLFIANTEDVPTLGMKILDEDENEEMVVVFNQRGALECQPIRPTTVISFLNEFELRFPVVPQAWNTSNRPLEYQWLAVGDDGKAYLRVQNDAFRYFVDIESGKVCQRPPGGTLVYPKSWEFIVFSEDKVPRTLAKFGTE